MYKKILVPYDKSEPARHALAEAVDMARIVDGATVTVLSVVDWRDYNAETFKIASRMAGVLGDSLDMSAISEVGEESAREETERISKDIADIIGDADMVDIAIVNGSPHDTITAYAAEGDYDVIVMGHRGMGAVRGMLGSVCYSVLHKTNKPVLVVK